MPRTRASSDRASWSEELFSKASYGAALRDSLAGLKAKEQRSTYESGPAGEDKDKGAGVPKVLDASLDGFLFRASDDQPTHSAEGTAQQSLLAADADAILNGGFVQLQPTPAFDADGGGVWGLLEDWPILPIHAILTPQNDLLTFGVGGPLDPGLDRAMYYASYDPSTGEHLLFDNVSKVNMWCSAAVLLPETGNVLIIGGYNDVSDPTLVRGNNAIIEYNPVTGTIGTDPTGGMDFHRWYPTAVTMANGHVLMLGGSGVGHHGMGMSEVYVPGMGTYQLTDAFSDEIAADWSYPRAWTTSNGRVFIMTSDDDAIVVHNGGRGMMMMLDPSGKGQIEVLGPVPFDNEGGTPAIMYAEDKVLHLDYDGKLWSIDLSGEAPTFTVVGDLGGRHHYADLTILPDGRVFINGGSLYYNSAEGAQLTPHIWDPRDNSITAVNDEATPRLYHSNAILLPDGTVMSMAGGAPGPIYNDNAQIYYPDYLYDENGQLADRLSIIDVPTQVRQGEDFIIRVDDPAAVDRITFLKNGAVTHSVNMEERFLEAEFTRLPNGDILVHPPANANVFTPGAYNLYVLDADGVPSTGAPFMAAIAGEHLDRDTGSYVTLTGAADVLAGSGKYVLTDGSEDWQTGVVASNSRIDLDHDFQIRFTVSMTPGDGAGEGGVAFLLHNDPKRGDIQGADGNGLGALGVDNGVVLRFDPADDPAISSGFDPADYGSGDSGIVSNFKVVNESDTVLELFWINWDGVAISYGTIQPGATRNMASTFADHNWFLAERATGEPVDYLGAPKAGATIRVQEGDNGASVLFDPANYPSGDYGPVSGFTMTNENDFAVNLNWIDWDGNAVSYGTIQPGQSYNMAQTFNNHNWFITNTATGEAIDYLGAPTNGSHLTLRTPGNDPSLGMSGFDPTDHPSRGLGLHAEISLVNDSAFALDVLWINASGKPVPMARLQPGQSFTADTLTDANWMISDATTGKTLQVLQDFDDLGQISLDYDASRGIDTTRSTIRLGDSDTFETLGLGGSSRDLADGQTHLVRLDWDADTDILRYWVDGRLIGRMTGEDLIEQLGSEEAYFAFTGATTTGSVQEIDVLQFEGIFA